MRDRDLIELLELWEKTSQGEWVVEPFRDEDLCEVRLLLDSADESGVVSYALLKSVSPNGENDMEFVARAHKLVPKMVKRIHSMTVKLYELQTKLELKEGMLASIRSSPPGYSIHHDNGDHCWWSKGVENSKENYSSWGSAIAAAWEHYRANGVGDE
jgi:hypothetical protein